MLIYRCLPAQPQALCIRSASAWHTLAALNPSLPSSSTSFLYPIGASSLYGPMLAVNLTVEVSAGRVGRVVVSVAEGAIVYECDETPAGNGNGRWKLLGLRL